MYDDFVTTSQAPFKEYRRSTRVPLDVSIEVEGEVGAIKGVTVVVNLHGALIRTVKPIVLESGITVTVYLTGKSAKARVVHVASNNALTCGIELEVPQNIWGVSVSNAPEDWRGTPESAASNQA